MAEGEQSLQPSFEFSAGNLGSVSLRRLIAYLMLKTGGERLPRRSDIDPTEIPRLLPHIFLIDVQPPRRFRFRLIGTHITRMIGEDNTGRDLQELPTGPFVPWLALICERCVTERTIQKAWGDINWAGRRRTRFEAFYLPMSGDGETVDMICGGAEIRAKGP